MNNNYIEQKKNTHLFFSIGKSKYAIDSDNILEIMKLPKLDYPQKLPNNIVGLLKYNNFVINVIDIRFYLNIEVTPYTINNELLIVKTDEIIFGIITDRVEGILPFNSLNIDQIPFMDNQIFIDSLCKKDNETIFIVNVYLLENIFKQHNTNYSSLEVNIPMLFPQDESSQSIMVSRTNAVSEKATLRYTSTELHAKNKYLSFNMNNDYYCIHLDYVKEVLKNTSITSVPGTPNFIQGIMNLRGDYITVINLKKFLFSNNIENKDTDGKTPVIIVDFNDFIIALHVDKINELFEFNETYTENSIDSYYLNEFIYNTVPYTVLNIEKIITDNRLIVTDV